MKYSISEVIEAARKNGYPWVKGKGAGEYGDGYFCVLQQASMNLWGHDDWTVLQYKLDHLTDSGFSKLDSPRIRKGVKKDYWFERITKSPGPLQLGALITAYNDGVAENYEEVVDFVAEILSPYKDRVIVFE